MEKIQLQPGKKIYFASDFHFGIPDQAATRERERKICAWLEQIRGDAQQIYLMGDLYDSWMEYKKVVPKGTIRFLGKLAELSDAGVELIIFTGNHDLWMHGYFEEELNARVYKTVQSLEINGKAFHIGHGDGVCREERSYRLLKALLHHPVSQFLYRQVHPDLGLRLADYFSRLGPKHKYDNLSLKPLEQEYQVVYAREVLQQTHYDYFIFGHRHIPMSLELSKGATLINLGDWMVTYTYAEFDGERLRLEKY